MIPCSRESGGPSTDSALRIPLSWCLAATLAVASMLGCGAAPVDPLPAAPASVEPKEADLQATLDETLDNVFEHRSLSLERNAAWQILHGVLAYRQAFLVAKEAGKEDAAATRVSAVQHILEGGAMRGWDVRPGVRLANGRRGLRVQMEVGSKAGQGHADQWFAILAQCDLPLDQTVQVGEQTFTIEDMLGQIQFDVPRNESAEYSWTLIGLTKYLPTTAEWQAIDGKTWSVERLVEIELEHDLHSSACGGTHRLIGIATACNRRLEDGEPIEGVWEQAELRLAEAIEQAKRLQNPDGSFSTRYLARPSTSPDLAQNLGASGHVLEFLAVSMSPEELREPWVQNAVLYLCDLLERTKDLPLECGALYHAVHGLVLYRELVYGPRPHALARFAERKITFH